VQRTEPDVAVVPTPALVCPRCRGRLAPHGVLIECESCHASFDVVAGVPILLPETLSGQQASQTRYFDAEFESFPTTYRPEHWRVSFVRRIFGALGIECGQGPYLDVGVGGAGATVIEAARLGVEATGCDLSVPGVVNASRLARSEHVDAHTHFVACAAESLPFADHSFSCASAVAVLEHVEDDPRAASELARVVRPGGRLWITVPLAYRYMLPPLWPVSAWHDRRLGHKRHYDEQRLVGLFARCSLAHVQTTYTGHAVKVLQFVLDRVLPSSTPRGDRVWWKLEHLDLQASHRPYGALQLNAVFRKPDGAIAA
jgi:SAM-dependent methyltransferase